MNPFDLPGPAFLAFYLVLASALVGCAELTRRLIEAGRVPDLHDMDPYLIASLRQGEHEAIRVAMLSLVDRRLLQRKGELLAASNDGAHAARRPLERAILDTFENASSPGKAFEKWGAPRAAAAELTRELGEKGLLPSAAQKWRRAAIGLVTAHLLLWTTLTKIEIAAARGHHNVFFLELLTALALGALFFRMRTRRTSLGDRVVSDLKTLFSLLRASADQVPRGGATNELALLAAVFGTTALPSAFVADALALFPLDQSPMLHLKKRGKDSHGGVGSDTYGGSTCGSSGGSSCGASCGGGGGGGGCGGCGGGGS